MISARRHLARLILTAAAFCAAGAASANSEPPGADALIAQVMAARRTTGYRVRARLIRTTSGSEQRDVKQLLIKGRQEGDNSKALYQILWPASLQGQTVVIEKTAGQNARAWMLTPPDRVATLAPNGPGGMFFGSDLTLEDVEEEYWHWPDQRIVGEETVGQRRCKILESRPPNGTASAYAVIRTWIAADISLPLRVEKFGRDGRLIKRISADKVARRKDNSWTAADVIVEPADGRTRTVLEGTRAERDIDVPDKDFTVEQIEALLHSKS
jgi:hypothetical protein